MNKNVSICLSQDEKHVKATYAILGCDTAAYLCNLHAELMESEGYTTFKLHEAE